MDFSYSEEQQMLRESVGKFVQQQYDFDSRNRIAASETGYSDENWKLFGELGWLTVPFDEADGGFGDSAVDLMVMMEEFGKAMVVEPYLASVVLAGRLLAALGSEEQKAESLHSLMAGNLQLALAWAESSSRYNLANVRLSARSDGGNFVLDGTKVNVLNGPNADKLLLTARESGGATDSEGISAFLVDREAAGVHVQAYAILDGSQAAKITFSEVEVPASARLGDAGGVLTALEQVVDHATVAVCAQAVGALDAMLQKTVEYSKTRKQFGVHIGSFQALQHRMADMFMECQLARSITVMAAMQLDSDESAAEKAAAVSAAKSRVGKAIRRVGQEAVQIHGGIGMTDELDVSHLFRQVTGLELLFGDADFHTGRFARLQAAE
ncbi:MAG: pimeloyl-CoA dehydrogenase small subunit [Gammaproteobacteria bacterium]|nr:pimeloyl-CoA dehydrogenase small subunit [Gammaproteobacteria bacterium]